MLNICNEAARCLLCGDAACTAACSKGYDPAGMLRSIRFDVLPAMVPVNRRVGIMIFRCGSGRRRQPCRSGVPSRI